MLKRLLAGISALALAAVPSPLLALTSSQVTQQNAAPIDNPDGYTPQQLLRLPSDAMGAGATVGGRLIVIHAANNTIVAKMPAAIGHFHRDGFAAVGDGGAADYTGKAGACPLNSGAGDGGSQLPMADGCAYLDWPSVGFEASPLLFENVSTATDDTAAIKAAIATGHDVHIPDISTLANRLWTVSSDIPQTKQGQIIRGDGRQRTQLVINSNSGFTTGVLVSTASEPGPVLRDFAFLFAQPNSSPIQYVPAVYAQNVPRWRSEHMGYYACWICIDMRGNDGGTQFSDTQMSDFKFGRWIDGSMDTIRITDDHVFPFGIPSQLYNKYILSAGLPGGYSQIHNYVGRADDLKIAGGIYLAGQAFDVHKSTYNPNDGIGATITITGTRFDVSPALTCSGYADVTVTGTFGGSGGPGLTGFTNTACNLTLTGNYFQTSSAGTGTQSAPSQSVVCTNGGQTTLSGNIYDLGSADAPVIVETAGHLTMMGEKFNRNPNIAYPDSPIIGLTGGDTIAIGNSINSIGSGSGHFMVIQNDNAANRISLNSSPGYPAYTPSNPAGTYLAN